MLKYGSVCSGIEAASVAWDGLGWKAAWFAEIEKFPAAVLAHHYPDVANLGDMTKIAAMVRAGTVTAPDVMVGGTPCQAFSIAGLRKSLDDPRGQLTLSYVDLANAIDQTREKSGKEPAVHLWENVPGSLCTPDNAFGYFLAGMAGEDEPFEPGERPEPLKNNKFWRWNKTAGKHIAKWPKSGCIYGRQRRLVWRVLDAQHFGVPQRRRRVFVISSARNDFDPAQILLEFDGVRRNSTPCREPSQNVTATLASRTGAGGGFGTNFEYDERLVPPGHDRVSALTANGVGVRGADDNQAQAGHIIAAFGGGNCSGALNVAACLTAKGQRNDFDVETFAVQSATGDISHTLTAEGFDASEDGTGRGTPVIAYSSNGHGSFADGISALRAKAGADHESLAVHVVHGTQDPDVLNDLAHTIGRNQGQENGILAFSSKDYGGDLTVDISPTLRAGGSANSHANAGAPPAVAYCMQHALIGRKDEAGPQGKGWLEDVGFTLDSRPCADVIASIIPLADQGIAYTAPAIGHFKQDCISSTLTKSAGQGNGETQNAAFVLQENSLGTGDSNVALNVALRGREGGATAELGDDLAGTLRASSGGGDKAHIMYQMMVRRLTPKECERLQGFPDGWTLIPGTKLNKLSEDELQYLRFTHPDMPEEETHRLAADGPRYKAIGNSMAVPVMRWIGERIAAHLNVVANNVPQVPVAQLPGKKRRKKAQAITSKKFSRPFLKWAGGKFSALETIFANLPAGGRLIEPFVGGGSVFQNARYARNLLNDINPDLINLYRQLQGNPDAVIRTAQALVEGCDNNGAYTAIREEFNAREAHAVRHAALFLALMRTCFNGLCRYNQRNEFNVGWNKKRVNFFPTEALQAFAADHQHSEFMCGGFEEVIARAADGDVIFCDPPYEPMPDTNGFTNYSGTNFTMKDQMKLVECLIAAKKRGASVVITNSSALRILNLYLGNGLKLAPLKARRSVSCKGDTRETVTDIIAMF